MKPVIGAVDQHDLVFRRKPLPAAPKHWPRVPAPSADQSRVLRLGKEHQPSETSLHVGLRYCAPARKSLRESDRSYG
jgi:hypothetical protein